jgi:ankyrin repeat protein
MYVTYEVDVAQICGLIKNADSSTYVGYGGSLISGQFPKQWLNKELLLAAADGATQRVRMLLSNGANVDFKDDRKGYRGWTALHHAANTGSSINVVNVLIDSGCQVNTVDEDRCTALYLSLVAGNRAVAKALSDTDGIVNSLGPDGSTALHLAARAGYDEVVRGLLRTKLDPNVGDFNDDTALYHAACEGHAAVVQTLLSASDICDSPNLDGHTALWAAVENGNADTVRMLANSVGDVNSLCEYDRSLLMFAVEKRSIEVVRELLSAPNINRDSIDLLEDTVLQRAVRLDCTDETIQLLISSGCDVDLKVRDGKTALHIAVEKGDLAATTLLLANTASVDCKDSLGRTPLFTAAWQDWRIVQVLLDAQTDPNVSDHAGWTPLHLAVSSDDVESTAMLVKAGANVHARTDDGDTPLHRATLHRKIGAINVLLTAGAGIGDANNSGDTPLHIAATGLDETALSMILEEASSSYINLQNNKGETALHLAAHQGRYQNAQKLVKAGADLMIKDHRNSTPLDTIILYDSSVSYVNQKSGSSED